MINIYCAYDAIAQIDTLKPNPANPNKHPPEQIALLAKIIREQGWRNPIVISNRSGLITKGHARLEAARQLGAKMLPIDRQDYASDSEELADMIADNRIAELAEPDRFMLRELMEQLDTGDFDMDLTGFDHAALEELMTAAPPASDVDAEPQIDKADELRQKWGVERGQIWQLGEHRLMCGDSTSGSDVDALLAQERPSIMVTDPPYGVDYDPTWRADAGVNKNRLKMGKINNDDRVDWTQAWRLFPGDIAYIWHAGRNAAEVQTSIELAGFKIRNQIIWAKDRMALSRGDYHWQHEPCWYAVRNGKIAKRTNDRTQTTLWTIPSREDSGHGHGAQKPVECMRRPVQNHQVDVAYEPFCGSGTTIIACEQLGRKCRAMEIDPGYVAVSIQRYLDATGKMPKLL
jgi:DNA modification methylase